MPNELTIYTSLLEDIKKRIHTGQVTVSKAISVELTEMYWDIGSMLHKRQQLEGWGAGIIPKLANDIVNHFPELKGFSVRNLKRMLRFYREYSSSINSSNPIPYSGHTKVPQAVALLPWSHNIILFEQVKELDARFWYADQVIKQGWSRETLTQMIKNRSFERQGTAITNFDEILPDSQSYIAQQTFKDPYIFDFLTLTEQFKERELEINLLKHLEKFLLELGEGFSFVGRQYHVEVSDKDFYIDLLFYHLKLRSFVVIDLKKGEFKPEYAGKMNFYCSAVDEQLKHETDQPTIGLILCQTKDRILAEYSLRGMTQPIGVSDYDLTRALPDNLKSSLPSIEEIEAELLADINNKSNYKL